MVQYNFEAKTFKMYFDDADRSSFSLGTQPRRYDMVFDRLWGKLKEIEHALDASTSAGTVQLYWKTGVVISVLPQDKSQPDMKHATTSCPLRL